jgi:hypothetical protein
MTHGPSDVQDHADAVHLVAFAHHDTDKKG